MKITNIISRIFFPEKCPVCKNLISINEEYCLCCGTNETRVPDECGSHCGKENCVCDKEFSAFLPHITGVFIYDGLTRNKLLSFKYRKRKELYKYFGDAMSEKVAVTYPDIDFDVITFVPSSKEGIREKGYNPAKLMAYRVSEKLFIPCSSLLIKAEGFKRQHILSAYERMTNIKGSITADENACIKGKTILLCDDIKTTGATLKECCDVLFEKGAKDVYCITAAIVSDSVNFSSLDKDVQNK